MIITVYLTGIEDFRINLFLKDTYIRIYKYIYLYHAKNLILVY